ncbi:unnamed protein product [Closterium sp. NIES-53]
MEVARTSMIHAAAPHLLRPFAVWYVAHQLNLWPRVSLPETSPTLRWTEKVGDASVFRVWGSRAVVRNTSTDKLSARAIPCIFLGFVPDAPGWQFYHPTSRRVLPSQDVTFDESVPFYHPLPPQGPAPSGVSQVDPLPGTAPVHVAVGSGAAPSAASRGVASWGATSGGAEPVGAGSEGAGSGGAEPGGTEPGGAESEGAESGGAAPGVLLCLEVLSVLHRDSLCSIYVSGLFGEHTVGVELPELKALVTLELGVLLLLRELAVLEVLRLLDLEVLVPVVLGAAGTGGVGCARAGDPTEPGAAGAEGAGSGGAGVGGIGAGASPLPAPSPYTEQSGGLIERPEPASRPVSPVCTARRAPCSCPPPIPGTHAMALSSSSVPLHVPLPDPPESSLPEVPDPALDSARADSPTVSRLLATAVTNPSFESAVATALVAERLDFSAACHLEYATALFAELVSAGPPSVGGECALGTDILEDKMEDFECIAALGDYGSLLLSVAGSYGCRDGILQREAGRRVNMK